MRDAVLKLDSRDNVLIALRDLRKCEQVSFAGTACVHAGPIVSGEKTVDEMGDAILAFLIRVVNRAIRTKAEMLGQDDFIPWKRGVSL